MQGLCVWWRALPAPHRHCVDVAAAAALHRELFTLRRLEVLVQLRRKFNCVCPGQVHPERVNKTLVTGHYIMATHQTG